MSLPTHRDINSLPARFSQLHSSASRSSFRSFKSISLVVPILSCVHSPPATSPSSIPTASVPPSTYSPFPAASLPLHPWRSLSPGAYFGRYTRPFADPTKLAHRAAAMPSQPQILSHFTQTFIGYPASSPRCHIPRWYRRSDHAHNVPFLLFSQSPTRADPPASASSPPARKHIAFLVLLPAVSPIALPIPTSTSVRGDNTQALSPFYPSPAAQYGARGDFPYATRWGVRARARRRDLGSLACARPFNEVRRRSSSTSTEQAAGGRGEGTAPHSPIATPPWYRHRAGCIPPTRARGRGHRDRSARANQRGRVCMTASAVFFDLIHRPRPPSSPSFVPLLSSPPFPFPIFTVEYRVARHSVLVPLCTNARGGDCVESPWVPNARESRAPSRATPFACVLHTRRRVGQVPVLWPDANAVRVRTPLPCVHHAHRVPTYVYSCQAVAPACGRATEFYGLVLMREMHPHAAPSPHPTPYHPILPLPLLRTCTTRRRLSVHIF
ncbi:hypothetical protein B0H16DRAFT_1899783 [Mycena metata]|uniref:Uncharacterized protein n=1 Tax=Mycena metata TaxID=1033252 RepID=A0AAD7H6L6_9AGAR|nr:hypothetical protein B0H16DRAFT_1899783 [Mycena metata]